MKCTCGEGWPPMQMYMLREWKVHDHANFIHVLKYPALLFIQQWYI